MAVDENSPAERSGLQLPRWEAVAGRLDALVSGPTREQLQLAEKLSLDIPASLPSPVAAVVLDWTLRHALNRPFRQAARIPEVLGEIEDELGVGKTRVLHTGTVQEVSAWFHARYMLKTLRGLREIKPERGDIVKSPGWKPGEQRTISSISDSGRVYMHMRPSRSAWPNNLEIVRRVGADGYEETVAKIRNKVIDATDSTSTNYEKFAPLDAYKLDTVIPSYEAVRAFEELLESGERLEEPLQKLLAKYPQLLAPLVVGNWRTYVIPKPKLGSEYVPDFLVLGINSLGPQWVAVEIEGARHQLLTRKRELRKETRHAIRQVQDWREWLASNVAYVQMEAGFHGLTSRVPGVVVIGRGDPTVERQASRSLPGEESRIVVHSWDWLLRGAQGLSEDPLHQSPFALNSLKLQKGYAGPVDQVVSAGALSIDDLIDQLDDGPRS